MKQKVDITNRLEMTMEQKVKRIIIASFAAINFFLLMGYINNVVIVLFLNSPIISLAINVEAKIINVPLIIDVNDTQRFLVIFKSYTSFDFEMNIINTIRPNITKFAMTAPLTYAPNLNFFISNRIKLSTYYTSINQLQEVIL